MKKIYILVNKYPNILEPNTSVFVQQLVWSFADLDYDCNVICPLPINLNKKYINFSKERIETNENGKKIKIYHPKYLSLGQKGKLLRKIRVRTTTFLYTRAVNRILRKENNKDFIIYSHFICPAGVAAAKLGKKYGVKSFFAHGEALYVGDKKYGNKYLSNIFKNITGVIAVSSQNKNYLVKSGVVDAKKIEVFPNGYRKERFYPINKKDARKHFNWSSDKFIVGFCGSFDDRKGIMRLEKAVEMIDSKDIVFACAGKGKLIPTSKKCILKDSLDNSELLYFYNALDLFVLPTQNEGCCNAIVEAVACGCPIISSNKDFNFDILNDKNSILIDPNDVKMISNSIEHLMNQRDLLLKMSKESIKKSKELTLEERARKIADFIEKKDI